KIIIIISNAYFVQSRIKKSNLFVDKLNINAGIIKIFLYSFWVSSPTNHKLFLKNFVVAFQIFVAIVGKIHYAVQCEFNIVFGGVFNGFYYFGIHVFYLNIKILRHRNTAISKKNGAAPIFPNVFAKRSNFSVWANRNQAHYFI